jgi:predicted transcriptional regulator
MMTITLTIPDDLAATLEVIPEHERNHFAVALMRDGLAYREEEQYEETQEELAALAGPLTPEDLASLGRGFADADAGRWQSGPEALDELRCRLGLRARA